MTAPAIAQALTKSYRYQGVITAMSSIAHGGGSKGVTQFFHTEKMVGPDGSVVEVPTITGNSLRGILRDAGMKFMLRCLGDPPLSVQAVHFLFSGGSLSKKPAGSEKKKSSDEKKLGQGAAATIAIGDARKIMEVIPLVGVFGGSCGSMIMESKLRVGKAIPICAETTRIVPERFQAGNASAWDFLQVESYTRRDDSKRESIRQLLSPEERKLLDDGLAKARQATLDEEADTEVGQHQQMRYHVQTLAMGTPFYWWLELQDATDIEWEALASCLVEFSRHPAIGGKTGVGHGQVDIKLENWCEIGPAVQADKALGRRLGDVYREHIEGHKEEILSLLNRL